MPQNARSMDRSADDAGETRRDFLYLATGATAAVGITAAVWPLIDSLSPAADVRALAPVEVALGPIEVGQRITVAWRGRPVFIDHRSTAQIASAKADDRADLKDPEPDNARVQRDEWLIVVGICTHLGCVPLGQRQVEPKGKWAGWFCHCHGSHYDTSGRVRKGAAPRNLEVPAYVFLDGNRVRIG
jgi:ubiquinol-cytochrome c reductase iron-sulfur subunit